MRGRPGVTFVETLIVAALVVFLLACALPRLKRSPGEPRSGTGVLLDMKQIDAAKDQYAEEHRKKPGDPVTMEILVEGGYLPGAPQSLPPGSRFIVGSIGAPVTITSEPEHHDHPHEQRVPAQRVMTSRWLRFQWLSQCP